MVKQQVNSKTRITLCAALVAGSFAFPAGALAQGTASRSTPAAKGATSEAARLAAKLRDEDVAVHQRLMALRAQYLKGSSWANLGDRCNPGALRIFSGDTSSAQRDSLQKLTMRMEQTIVGRGAGTASIDTPDGRALLRVIVGWEAGIDRPNWDSDDRVARQAIATGLTGDYPDPRGTGCLSSVENDTVTVVAPGFTDMVFPRSEKVRIKAYLGAEAINHARNEFVSAHRNDPNSKLSYIFISPVVIWRDWAVVVATRPVEERGVVIGKTNNGGSAYLMRKVGTEWRLLSILRSWGS